MCNPHKYKSTDLKAIYALAVSLRNSIPNGSKEEDISLLIQKILMLLGIKEFSYEFLSFFPYAVTKYVEGNLKYFDNMPSSIHQLTTEQLFCILLIGAERQDEFNRALKEHSLKDVIEQLWNWHKIYQKDSLVFRFLEFFRVIETALGFSEDVVISFEATILGYYPFYDKVCMLSTDSVVLPSPEQDGFEVVKITKETMFDNLKNQHFPDEEKISFLQEILEVALTVNNYDEETINGLELFNCTPISTEEYKNQWIAYNKYQNSSFHPAY